MRWFGLDLRRIEKVVNIKLYLVIAASSFGLMIVGSIIAGLFGARGYTTDPQLEKTMLIIYGVLFLALSFAAVPILLRVFTTLQAKIGNGDLPPIRWIRKNEFVICCWVWGIFLLGLIIALPTALKDWFSR
jgi:hypothetical protein